MALEWMGEYRDVIGALMHYCNIYSISIKPEAYEYKGVMYSFALIQVVEYLIANSDNKENMSSISQNLGLTRSNFTKIVKKLEQKGLVKKIDVSGNKKELNLKVTPLGRELYENYSNMIYEHHFSMMFDKFQKIPPQYLKYFAEGLQAPLEDITFLN